MGENHWCSCVSFIQVSTSLSLILCVLTLLIFVLFSWVLLQNRDELTLSTQLTTDLTASLTKLTTLPPSLSPALPQPPILPLSDSTLNLLHNYLTSPSHSPLLLSAPEGSGTSVLLKRLLSEISESGHKTLPRHHGRPPLIISYFVGGGGKKQEKRNGRSYLDILGHFVQCVEEEFPGVKKRKEEEGFVKELTR